MATSKKSAPNKAAKAAPANKGVSNKKAPKKAAPKKAAPKEPTIKRPYVKKAKVETPVEPPVETPEEQLANTEVDKLGNLINKSLLLLEKMNDFQSNTNLIRIHQGETVIVVDRTKVDKVVIDGVLIIGEKEVVAQATSGGEDV